MSYGRKIDANQNAIVDALRKAGASVYVTSNVHRGFPDLCVGVAGRTLLFELKDGNKPPSARKLTPDQVEWHKEWKGHVAVVETVEQALKEIER